MTKEEFHKLEAICKKAWKNLSITGKSQKPKYLEKYEEECSACEISARVNVFFGGEKEFACIYCPITTWRRKAIRSQWDYDDGICLKSFYGKWNGTRDMKNIHIRQVAAKNIANMNWTWLKVYEKI